jgi:hypothetical protein
LAADDPANEPANQRGTAGNERRAPGLTIRFHLQVEI